MWYEILPSMAIMCVGVTAPPIFSYYLYKLVHKGNPYRRTIGTDFNIRMYRRDEHLTGNTYVQKGFEGLPQC